MTVEAVGRRVELPAPALQYLEDLATRRRLSPRTLAAYRRDIEQLLRAAGGALPLGPAAAGVLRASLARLHGSGAGPRSLARTLSAWRGLYGWLAKRARIDADPTAGLRAPRAGARLPKALAPDHAVRFVAHETDGSWLQRRDRALVELLYSSGLRLAELVSLDHRYHGAEAGQAPSRSWLDLAERSVTVHGKGGRTRSVPVGDGAARAIAAWLQVRDDAALAADGARALFVSRRGTRLAARSVEARVAALARRLGFEVPVHPHVLRHSMASHVLQSSGDLRAVQELLGHANIATTQVYTKLDWQHLARAYDAAHPRARRRK
ncbi:MAG TPA: tyrosine recombinase XerC [Burkholderiaceae bacterium]|nr:tyrosine recombinase XerC [Burkholderiaceae bacterium]